MEGLKQVEDLAVTLLDLPLQGCAKEKLLKESHFFSLFDSTFDLTKFTYVRSINDKRIM